MKTSVQAFIVSALFCACVPRIAFSQAPAGYDWVLTHHGGQHIDIYSDPYELFKLGARWARSHEAPLAFFTSELSSTDPRHVKAGMLSLATLARGIDLAEPHQVSDEVKAKFNKAFPLEKLKQVLDAHPEYVEWLDPIQRSERVRSIPQLQSPPERARSFLELQSPPP